MYSKYHLLNFSIFGMSVLSKCNIKIPANTRPRGDPMATPAFYL